jgi:hypothetical protein
LYESKLLLWHFVIVLGWDAKKAFAEFENWLRTRHHKSQDLEDDREGTIKDMLKVAPHWIQDLLSHRKGTGQAPTPWKRTRSFPGGGVGSPPPPITITTSTPFRDHRWSSFSLTVRRVKEEAGPIRWQKYVESFWTAKDKVLLAALKSEWVRRNLGVFIGLLRAHLEAHPGENLVAIPARVVQSFVGGKGYRKPVPGQSRVLSGANYTQLMRVALTKGLLELELGAIQGVHCAVYLVNLP